MAGTYSKIYLHIMMVVKHRKHALTQSNMDRLAENVSEILLQQNQKPLIIAGTPDHLHLLIAMNPNYSVAEMVRVIRSDSTRFIIEQKWVRGRFCWQMGFGVFSYGQSQFESISAHIRNQTDYHRTKSCREEFVEFLEKFEIPFAPEFLFRFPEEEAPE